MEHIVFLDIDGVLASFEFLMKRKGFVDPEKIKLLNNLSIVDAKIVISSSWGEDGGRTEKALRECGLKLPIIGYTSHFHADHLCRGNEIEKWLKENFPHTMGSKFGFKPEKYNFVIFDDDTDMLLGQKEHFIEINRETALTQEDINTAIKIFENEG